MIYLDVILDHNKHDKGQLKCCNSVALNISAFLFLLEGIPEYYNI